MTNVRTFLAGNSEVTSVRDGLQEKLMVSPKREPSSCQWRDMPNDESVFDKFLLTVIPQLDRRAEEELLATAAADDDVVEQCQQVPMGRRVVTEGANAGRTTNAQQRCGACKAEGRKEVNKHGEPTSATPRTSYTCSVHPGVYCCHSTKVLTHPERDCWQRHLQSHDAVEE